jgi:integral membrane sensor domain MASE1
MRLVSALAVLAAAIPPLVESSRLTPPVLPLIVRNPYLSTWLGNARDPPWEKWPMFWTGQEIGFSILASVSEQRTVYPLLGRPQDSLPKKDQKYVPAT